VSAASDASFTSASTTVEPAPIRRAMAEPMPPAPVMTITLFEPATEEPYEGASSISRVRISSDFCGVKPSNAQPTVQPSGAGRAAFVSHPPPQWRTAHLGRSGSGSRVDPGVVAVASEDVRGFGGIRMEPETHHVQAALRYRRVPAR